MTTRPTNRIEAPAQAERRLAAIEVSNARDLATTALVRLDLTKDGPLTPEEFGEQMRQINEAKNYLHSAAVRLRRAYRREQAAQRRAA